jgi:peptide methionine sulfoxide reductase msrA/msrB
MKKITILNRGIHSEYLGVGILIIGLALFMAQTHVNSNSTLKKVSLLKTTVPATQPADDTAFAQYQKPSDAKLRTTLSPLQYAVTQGDATEKPFDNPYWHSKEVGIYVDVVSGEPLFSSRDKYDSGTGWPSFTRPISAKFITTKQDSQLGYSRIEARSRYANSHLGHIFNDGPTTLAESGGAEPTGLRYCMNSAALRFVPKSELGAQGLSAYEALL